MLVGYHVICHMMTPYLVRPLACGLSLSLKLELTPQLLLRIAYLY